MVHRVCPWWLGYILASPLRRLLQRPRKIIKSYIHERLCVLEPGPGMGFFTLELARGVGPSGRVVAVDLERRMLSSLKRRLARANLLDRVDVRLATPQSLGIEDLAGTIDFTLAFALVHEVPAPEALFFDIATASKPGAGLLFVEPSGHVKEPSFETELELAIRAGFKVIDRPIIRRSRAAFLTKG